MPAGLQRPCSILNEHEQYTCPRSEKSQNSTKSPQGDKAQGSVPTLPPLAAVALPTGHSAPVERNEWFSKYDKKIPLGLQERGKGVIFLRG